MRARRAQVVGRPSQAVTALATSCEAPSYVGCGHWPWLKRAGETKTKEEIEKEKREKDAVDKVKREKAVAERKKELHDRMLLETYTTESDILLSRDDRIQAVDSQIALTESNIKESEKKWNKKTTESPPSKSLFKNSNIRCLFNRDSRIL